MQLTRRDVWGFAAGVVAAFVWIVFWTNVIVGVEVTEGVFDDVAAESTWTSSSDCPPCGDFNSSSSLTP